MAGLFKHSRIKAKSRGARRKASAMAGILNAVLGLATPKPARTIKAASPRAGSAAKKKTRRAAPGTVTAQGLAAGGSPRRRTTAPAASFRAAVHSCEHGKRRYKIFTPACASDSPEPLPLLIMLHGCGQTPDDFARGTRMNALAEKLGVLVVYPAQPRETHSNRCWNWFRDGDQRRGAGEPAQIASLARHIINRHGADPARVYIAGLSAGASMALIVAAAYPDIFAAVGAHSGLPTGAAQDKTSAVVAMQRGNPGQRRTAPVPTIVFHGTADGVVNPRNGRLIAIRALEPYPALRRTEVAGQVDNGRAYVKTTHRKGKGRPYVEHWTIKGGGHAWSGGASAGLFSDPKGPDASAEMLRFFLRHKTSVRRRAGP